MTTATLTISERYELGRSDGYADGYHAAQWSPAYIHDEIAEHRDRVRIARVGRESLAYFSAKHPDHYESARAFQAYTVGQARGFREAVNNYKRGEETMKTSINRLALNDRLSEILADYGWSDNGSDDEGDRFNDLVHEVADKLDAFLEERKTC